jgi:hypothetical protein
MRTYALGDESALLVATYPNGGSPRRPFPYDTEVFTGLEYTAATGMIYEGMARDGLSCIRDIRARYDGRKRNPFDEAECGHHYARAMASWASVIAFTGFRYSAVSGEMAFSAHAGASFFWSNGSAWGTCRQDRTPNGLTAHLSVLQGELVLGSLSLNGAGRVNLPEPRLVKSNEMISLEIKSI